MSDFRPCIVIPVYNHGDLFSDMIAKLIAKDIFLILVNDGSNNHTTQILKTIAKQYTKQIELIDRPINQGKGKAVITGLIYACEQNYTHALQIDADGQHCLGDIDVFLEKAQQNPQSIINGCPIYDESVPKIRFYGRKFTNMWVNIETLSNKIKDSMCGFRVYPLGQKTLSFLQQNKLNYRMGFDIDILVRMYWEGYKIINQDTKVIYPLNGISNFHMIKDNIEISKTHARLLWHTLVLSLKLWHR